MEAKTIQRVGSVLIGWIGATVVASAIIAIDPINGNLNPINDVKRKILCELPMPEVAKLALPSLPGTRQYCVDSYFMYHSHLYGSWGKFHRGVDRDTFYQALDATGADWVGYLAEAESQALYLYFWDREVTDFLDEAISANIKEFIENDRMMVYSKKFQEGIKDYGRAVKRLGQVSEVGGKAEGAMLRDTFQEMTEKEIKGQ